MIRRSAVVAVAVTLQQLAAGKISGWTGDQALVLDALRRAKTSLAHASDGELGNYVRDLAPERLRGVASNVKGIFHEMLVARAENIDGDGETARLFEATNYPGADLEFSIDGDVVRALQLKAVQDPATIVEHFARYPDIDVMATSEVCATMDGTFSGHLFDSGVSNADISETTRQTLEDLAGRAWATSSRTGC